MQELITGRKKFKCLYCGKPYHTLKEKRNCENNHVTNDEVIFVPLLKEELNRLGYYILNGDRSLLTEQLSRKILRYFRANK